jgi:YD repeat-containing protein
VWTPDADVNSRLSKTGNGWVYVTARDETETYNANGQLLSLANRAGWVQTFVYDARGRLTSVADPFGRALTFSYMSSTSPLIAQVRAPDGGVYAYSYDANSRLVAVTFPDSSKRKYLYENTSYPNALTGVIDENGSRYTTVAYDANGLALSSQHAGGADLYSVDYTYMGIGVPSGLTHSKDSRMRYFGSFSANESRD